MSFVVRDVPMPKNCWECPCWWSDPESWSPSYCRAGSKYSEGPYSIDDQDNLEQTGRPKDCPLFELKDWRDV